MGQSTVLNLGSLNIDRVFRVDHIGRPGETIAGRSFAQFAGGKGANQSVALARAGARVAHLGKIGPDGRWLVDKLAREGIDTSRILTDSEPTGQAIIQVDSAGENSILIWPGANCRITPDEVDVALEGLPSDAWLLVQNETSSVDHAICRAADLGMRVAINLAPCDPQSREFPLELAHLLCVNQSEGAALTGQSSPDAILGTLAARWPNCEIVLTLGAGGAAYRQGRVKLHRPAPQVTAVDTTAAGDAFWGYFLAHRIAGREAGECLEIANRAAALCVTRPGAMDSIPRAAEVAN